MKFAQFVFLLLLLLIAPKLYGQQDSNFFVISDQLIASKQYKSAIDTLRALKPMSLKNDCATIAEINHKIGICYYRLQQDSMALVYWRDSTLQRKMDCYGQSDYRTIKTISNIAQACRYLGLRSDQLSYLEKAMVLMENMHVGSEDSLSVATKYRSFGDLYMHIEDFEKALFYYDKARTLSPQKKDVKFEARLSQQLGILYRRKQEYNLSKKHLARGLQMAKSASMPLWTFYHNLGNTHYLLNSLDSASYYLKMAKDQDGERNKSSASLLNKQLQGLIQKKRKNHQAALSILNEVLNEKVKAQGLALHPSYASTYENIADIHVDLEKYSEALSFYQSALMNLTSNELIRKISDNPKTYEVDDIILNHVIRLLGLKVKVLFKLYEKDFDPGNLHIAQETGMCLDTLVRRFRRYNKKGNDKLLLSEITVPYYEYMLLIQKSLYDLNSDPIYHKNAYRYLLDMKSILLMENIEQRLLLDNYVPADILKKEKQFRNDLYRTENHIAFIKNSERRKSYESERLKIMFEYDEFLNSIENKYANYYQNKFDYDHSKTIDNIQHKLDKTELLLDFFEGDQAMYFFEVSTDNIRMHTMPNSSELDNKNKDEKSYINEVFDTLIKPCLTQQHGLNNKLIVVPSGILHKASFDIFLLNDQPLIKSFDISYLYSSKQLITERKKDRPKQRYTGFAIDYKEIDDIHRKSLFPEFYLSNLEGTQKEIDSGIALFGGSSYVNSAVTKKQLSEAINTGNILHLAMHAVASTQEARKSGLILYDESQALNVFNMNDILASDINNDLTILSACQTGAGKTYSGEGIMSLARAFINAGSQSVLVNINNSSDAASQQIIKLFLQKLKEGQRRDHALKEAKLEYIDAAPPAYRDPKYWAHILLIGDGSPISKSNHSYLFWVIPLLLLSGCIYWFKR